MEQKLIFKVTIVILFLSILFACVTETRVIPSVVPIVVDFENTAGISFTRVVFQAPPGTTIGAAHKGWEKTKILWRTSISVGDELFNEVANEELREAGYQVIGSERLLFNSNEQWKAQFLLGARITDIKYNTYDNFDSEKNKTILSVKWELFDKSIREVVFRKQTYGDAEVTESLGTESIFMAFRYALRQLLADESFVSKLILSDEKSKVPEKEIFIEQTSLPSFENNSELIKRTIESVVTIKVEYGHASGFIISKEGYVITNNHVIEGKNIIDVILANGIILQADVIRANPDYDLALLKIEGRNFKPLPLGDKKDYLIGTQVFAIGTPAEIRLAQSVTSGVLSGIRTIEYRNVLQTDASLNPGNSGGPLINSKGTVIGVVQRRMIGREELNFCIPIDTALRKLGILVKKQNE